MGQDIDARLRQLLEDAIAADNQADVERLLTEFRLLLDEHVATAKIGLHSQRFLLGQFD